MRIVTQDQNQTRSMVVLLSTSMRPLQGDVLEAMVLCRRWNWRGTEHRTIPSFHGHVEDHLMAYRLLPFTTLSLNLRFNPSMTLCLHQVQVAVVRYLPSLAVSCTISLPSMGQVVGSTLCLPKLVMLGSDAPTSTRLLLPVPILAHTLTIPTIPINLQCLRAFFHPSAALTMVSHMTRVQQHQPSSLSTITFLGSVGTPGTTPAMGGWTDLLHLLASALLHPQVPMVLQVLDMAPTVISS